MKLNTCIHRLDTGSHSVLKDLGLPPMQLRGIKLLTCSLVDHPSDGKQGRCCRTVENKIQTPPTQLLSFHVSTSLSLLRNFLIPCGTSDLPSQAELTNVLTRKPKIHLITVSDKNTSIIKDNNSFKIIKRMVPFHFMAVLLQCL